VSHGTGEEAAVEEPVVEKVKRFRRGKGARGFRKEEVSE
jgi:hypothetical protein